MSEDFEPEEHDPLAPRLTGRLKRVRLRAKANDPVQMESSVPRTNETGDQSVANLVNNNSRSPRWTATIFILCGWIIVLAVGFASRFNYGLEDDELQHLHMAWKIGQGQVPFRDFFELHPPLFHYLLAPFVSEYTRFAQTPFLMLRLLNAGVLLLIMFGAFNVLRRQLPRAASAWGAGLFLTASSFSYALYDFRPDWLALFMIVGIVWLISQRPSRADDVSHRAKLRRAAIAGVLAAIAAMLTQKAWFLLVAIVVWNAASAMFAPNPKLRRMRFLRMLAFLATAGGLSALMLAYFAVNGAAGAFIRDNFLLQLHSPRERWFAGYIRATAPFSAGVLSLAVLSAIKVIGNWRAELEFATTRGLIVALGIVGALAYVATPVPYEQSFVFLLLFWICLMAVDVAWQMIVEPKNWRTAPRWLALSIVVLAATQKNLATAALVGSSWLTMLALATLASVLTMQSGRSRMRIFAVGIAVTATSSFLVLATDVGNIRNDHRRVLQANLYDALDARLAPNEPIITLWPPALPFRPHVGFYPFAHQFIVEQYAKEIEPAYLEAMRSGQVRIIAGYEPWFAATQMPGFDAELRRSFHPLTSITPIDRNYNVYLRNDVK